MSDRLDDLQRCPRCRSADILVWNLCGQMWKCVACDDRFSKPFVYSEFYATAPSVPAAPDVHTTVNITETVNKMRIQSAIRAAFPGGCRLLSNASCDCLLCALDSLLALKDTQLQALTAERDALQSSVHGLCRQFDEVRTERDLAEARVEQLRAEREAVQKKLT